MTLKFCKYIKLFGKYKYIYNIYIPYSDYLQWLHICKIQASLHQLGTAVLCSCRLCSMFDAAGTQHGWRLR